MSVINVTVIRCDHPGCMREHHAYPPLMLHEAQRIAEADGWQIGARLRPQRKRDLCPLHTGDQP